MNHSQELFAHAQQVLPGGVNSPVRAMRQIGRTPVFVEKGEGAELIDVDGARYIDYVCSWGALILGHADRDVVQAVEHAARRGTSFGAPTAAESELADAVIDRVASVEMLRMTSSGTEAGMSVVRLARAATDRTKILKFAGAYHGHSDALLAAAGSGLATLGTPDSPGVTVGSTQDTVPIEWNDLPALEQACADHEFAAIIAEPCPANMGLVPPDHEFLRALRTAADDNGALLIFDEVITGFRTARGGYQQLAGVKPDLTMFGKILGGGVPAAAYGGRRELMEQIAPQGDVYQAGTLSGNPLATAAGLATLRKLDDAAYRVLDLRTQDLARGIADAAADVGVRVSVVSECGLMTVFFSEQPPRNFEQAKACNTDQHADWCRELLERGVYPPPSQFEAWFLSLAHDDALIDRTVRAAAAAFRAVAT